uniref:Histone deacetylase domain-containing protein n=1 Tax=Kalmanozyma brasiliensis (strain GHG001) TaxID=1365824 RepID=V5EEP1_KALBG
MAEVDAKSRRVAYIVSDDLVKYADLLPSNKGRSSLVHSLAYHLDLLDLSGLEDADDKGVGPSSAGRLQKAFAAHPPTQSSDDAHRQRATVHLPRAATHQQLTSYHEESFVKQLAKGAGDLEHHSDAKRRRLNSPSSLDEEPASSDRSSHDPDTSSELQLRPSSSVTGTNRERGYKRPRPSKNQFGLQDDCPAFSGLPQHVALVAGAAITAADLLATGQTDIAIAWDGGRHHAKKDSASGFCYVNDVVLAILSLRKPRRVTTEDGRKTTKRAERVLYLDLDLHWGDGVEEAFHSSPNVLTLSIHHYAPGFFPCYAPSADPNRYTPPGSLKSDTGAGSKTLNIPLGIGTSDASLERVLTSNVEPLVEAWQPKMVVVQCGVDGLAGDPMAVWNLSAAAYVRAIQRVLGWNKPTLLLGGGGYCNHKFWPNYAPTYTLDAPAGEMIDQNDEAHFEAINKVFLEHIKKASSH